MIAASQMDQPMKQKEVHPLDWVMPDRLAPNNGGAEDEFTEHAIRRRHILERQDICWARFPPVPTIQSPTDRRRDED